MRYIKLEKKYKGNNLSCYGCRGALKDCAVMNHIAFKGDHHQAKNIYLCNSCTDHIGKMLSVFALRKGYPVCITLEYELRNLRGGSVE